MGKKSLWNSITNTATNVVGGGVNYVKDLNEAQYDMVTGKWDRGFSKYMSAADDVLGIVGLGPKKHTPANFANPAAPTASQSILSSLEAQRQRMIRGQAGMPSYGSGGQSFGGLGFAGGLTGDNGGFSASRMILGGM